MINWNDNIYYRLDVEDGTLNDQDRGYANLIKDNLCYGSTLGYRHPDLVTLVVV